MSSCAKEIIVHFDHHHIRGNNEQNNEGKSNGNRREQINGTKEKNGKDSKMGNNEGNINLR